MNLIESDEKLNSPPNNWKDGIAIPSQPEIMQSLHLFSTLGTVNW